MIHENSQEVTAISVSREGQSVNSEESATDPMEFKYPRGPRRVTLELAFQIVPILLSKGRRCRGPSTQPDALKQSSERGDESDGQQEM